MSDVDGEEGAVIFVGDDWSEAYHDVCVLDEAGVELAKARVPDTLEGVGQFHAVLAGHVDGAGEVVVGVETERGLFIGAVRAAGYVVYAINPLSVSRYRQRIVTSGAKSDPGDARVLADIVRTDRHQHRLAAADSELAEAVKVLARAHQALVWTRQRTANVLRSTLREFYPAAVHAFGADLAGRDALAVLRRAPDPGRGRALTKAQLVGVLRRAGRSRNLDTVAERLVGVLRTPNLEAPPVLAAAFAAATAANVAILTAVNVQIAALEVELSAHFESHPDAEIVRSLPGLGLVLGARALAEFGDDPDRYESAKARKCYAGTAPITRTSGTKRVVLARYARNTRVADTCYLWAFSALTASPGCRTYYDTKRARGASHSQALRALGNRLVGILHGCLRTHTHYNETVAWPPTRHATDEAA